MSDSDHSLGRCILYGVGASPKNIGCHMELLPSLNQSAVQQPDLLGMCFMTPQCDLTEQITCHRYVAAKRVGADGKVGVIAERIGTGANYRMYSSIYNGQFVDSKL